MVKIVPLDACHLERSSSFANTELMRSGRIPLKLAPQECVRAFSQYPAVR
jgi:hypothetical protein